MRDRKARTTGVAEVNGAAIHYEVAGAGHPLVLVHAGIADLRMWDDQFDTFAQHYRTLRYDMRGFGETPMVAGAFSHAADLVGLLHALDIERAHLLGCSKGGTTAIDVAVQHPALVAALIPVASNPSGYAFTADPPPLWDEIVAAFKRGDLERAAELEIQFWVDGLSRTPDQLDPAVRAKVREMDLIALRNEAAALGSEQESPPAIDRIAEITAPTLVINGDLDDAEMISASEQMAATIPNARHAVMPGTAHLPNMERPAEFNRLVLDFLAEL